MKNNLIEKIHNLFTPQSSPIIKENTFIVWEPCSKSHSEVVPGFCKYLLIWAITFQLLFIRTE